MIEYRYYCNPLAASASLRGLFEYLSIENEDWTYETKVIDVGMAQREVDVSVNHPIGGEVGGQTLQITISRNKRCHEPSIKVVTRKSGRPIPA